MGLKGKKKRKKNRFRPQLIHQNKVDDGTTILSRLNQFFDNVTKKSPGKPSIPPRMNVLHQAKLYDDGMGYRNNCMRQL